MNIECVIVTYKPNKELLLKTIHSILTQLNKIVIVNNDEDNLVIGESENIEVINLNRNYGIAYAQNEGIKKAITDNADFILLSDQDTEYPKDYIAKMNGYISKNLADVYCPIFYDNIKKVFSPVMIKKFKSVNKITEPTYVQHAIASGTLINRCCFDKVGLMNELLFIDYVDFEWCWRAVYNNIQIVTLPDIIINHNLGDGIKKIGKRNVTIRSNFRYYYILRNGFYLSFYSKYLSFIEKNHLFFRTVKFSLGVIIFKHNLEIILLCFRAFFNGLSKRLGANY